MTRTYTSHEIAELADVTYRQLDYWVRIGLVEPYTSAHGSGSRRVWTDVELARVKRVRLASLLSQGGLQDALDRLEDLSELLELSIA